MTDAVGPGGIVRFRLTTGQNQRGALRSCPLIFTLPRLLF